MKDLIKPAKTMPGEIFEPKKTGLSNNKFFFIFPLPFKVWISM